MPSSPPLTSDKPGQKPAPRFQTGKSEEGIAVHFGGIWKSASLEGVEVKLNNLLQKDILAPQPHAKLIKIIFDKDYEEDMAGACLIAQAIRALVNQKCTVDLKAVSACPLVKRFLDYKPSPDALPPNPSGKGITGWLGSIGYKACAYGRKIINLLSFLGEILVTGGKTFYSPQKLRWVSVFRQGEETGLKALPIIGLISFLIGMVLAYQSINQLSRFGAQLYTVDFLGVALLREIAVLITAIVIAGRSGSAFTAQIGSMALNQEIDAIRMLGLNPLLVLVIPRIIALSVWLPLLVFFSMLMGLLGGMVMVSVAIDLSPIQYLNQLQKAITPTTFWVGMCKAPIFAVIISLVGCYRGLQVKGSAESVGRQTTQSVVESIFLVIVFDAFISILFSYLKV